MKLEPIIISLLDTDLYKFNKFVKKVNDIETLKQLCLQKFI